MQYLMPVLKGKKKNNEVTKTFILEIKRFQTLETKYALLYFDSNLE